MKCCPLGESHTLVLPGKLIEYSLVRLSVNERRVYLTPTEHLVVAHLFKQVRLQGGSLTIQCDGTVVLTYLSLEMLMQRFRFIDASLVLRHVAHLTEKLRVHGLGVYPVGARGQRIGVLLTSTIERTDGDTSPPLHFLEVVSP